MDHLDEKDEYALEVEARMKAPLEWETTIKYKILDLRESLYDEALRLIKHHYLQGEPMCKASSLLQDKTSVEEYLELARTWMKDTTSLVATSVASGRVVGILIARINSSLDKTDTYNRVQILEGTSIQQINLLKSTLVSQTNAYERFEHEKYFCVYVICVHPSYRKKNVEIALLNAASEVAVTLKIPAIGGIFTSGTSQGIAYDAGFKLLHEIRYSLWVINDQVVFDDPGRGNYSAAFMGKLLPRIEESKQEELSSTTTIFSKSIEEKS